MTNAKVIEWNTKTNRRECGIKIKKSYGRV